MDSKYPYETICEESEDEWLVVSRMKSRIVFCFFCYSIARGLFLFCINYSIIKLVCTFKDYYFSQSLKLSNISNFQVLIDILLNKMDGKMNNLISVVVTCYNHEKYIEQCLRSVFNQTYTNIELIVLDDGSTDSSGEICDQYAREDNRIKVLHIENGGLSNARNTGVKESSTDWIVFIDSDDYYDHRAIEYLVKLRDKYRVDLVATPVIEVRNYENSDFLGDFREKYSGKLDRRKALEQMFYGNYVGTHSGGKLYKKEILLRFPYPKGMLYEDLALAYEHIASCENIAVSDLNLYKYYRRPGSIVNSKYSYRLLDFYKEMEWNRSYIERDYSGDRDMRRALNVRYVFNGLHIVHAMLSSDMYAEVNKIRKEYIQYFKDVIPNSNVTRKNKLKYILFLVSAKLYNTIRNKIG